MGLQRKLHLNIRLQLYVKIGRRCCCRTRSNDAGKRTTHRRIRWTTCRRAWGVGWGAL